MELTRVKLVTIIAEAVLEESLVTNLKQLGAKGYTIMDSRGEGSRGMRAAEIPGQNIRIETLVSPEAANRILEYVASHYFKNFAIVCYLTDASVLRGEKYI